MCMVFGDCRRLCETACQNAANDAFIAQGKCSTQLKIGLSLDIEHVAFDE